MRCDRGGLEGPLNKRLNGGRACALSPQCLDFNELQLKLALERLDPKNVVEKRLEIARADFVQRQHWLDGRKIAQRLRERANLLRRATPASKATPPPASAKC